MSNKPDSSETLTAGVILAGGENSRFDGLPKGSLPWDGESLFQRVRSAISSAVDSVYLSIHHERPAGLPEDMVMIKDEYETIRGPMNGIYSALDHTQETLLIVPWDMPGVTVMFLRELVEIWHSLSEDPRALYVKRASQIQPFPGIYHPSARDSLKQSLQHGEWGLIRWLKSESTHTVDVGTTPGPSPAPSNFKNVNSPEDIRDLGQYL